MKLKYRPEIDGLRAIAVGAVVLYHAQVTIFGYELFKGGFIGVDIFFVISGYLISIIILNEIIDTGKFSFKHFYERRIRRILPALLFTMLVSLPFAWIYLLPSSIIDFSKSILYSLGFSSNFYFHYTGQQYGADSGLLKPFLHTWSLSVEEQFYIFFPIILLFIIKSFRKYLIYILIISFLISLGFSSWTTKYYPSVSFYFLHTRIWELLAGSLLGYYEVKKGYRGKNYNFNNIFPTIGLLLILFSLFFYSNETFHPSLYTLSPIIGVCLVIWFSNKDEIITKILSTKLFVIFGLFSYSLYLWHYPIFAFAREINFFDGSILKKIFIVIIVLISSIFSYYFIERPARNKNYKFKYIMVLILVSISVLIFVNIKFIWKDGYKDRFFSTKYYELDEKSYLEEKKDFEINYNYDNYDSRKNVLIVGNSHGEDILKILSKTKLKNKIYFNLTSPKIRVKDYNFQINYLYKFLVEKIAIIDGYKGDFSNHLKKQYDKADLIILSTRYDTTDLSIFDDLIKILKKDNKKIIVFDNALEQTTKVRFNRLDYYVFKNKKLPNKKNLKKIEQDMFLDLINKKEINQKIEILSKKNNVFFIKRKEIFCNLSKKRCPAITKEGFKIYHDYGHITEKGAEFFAKIFEQNKTFLNYIDSSLYN